MGNLTLTKLLQRYVTRAHVQHGGRQIGQVYIIPCSVSHEWTVTLCRDFIVRWNSGCVRVQDYIVPVIGVFMSL